jgi:chromosome segregation ATPase
MADGCADAVQQAQHLAAAMQSDLVGRLQQQEAATQQALSHQQAASDALKQQLQDQATTLTAAQQARLDALEGQQKQQAEAQAAALSQAGTDLRKEVDAKLSGLEATLTGCVNDTSAGKAALTDSKLTEIR